MKVFTASWCQPCKAYKKMLDSNNIKYKAIDIDEDPETPRTLGIRGVPTTIFDDGTIKVGALTLNQVKEYV